MSWGEVRVESGPAELPPPDAKWTPARDRRMTEVWDSCRTLTDVKRECSLHNLSAAEIAARGVVLGLPAKAVADMPWRAERTEALRELWKEGLSATQIAEKLGSPLTRCSVLGMVRRLGLPARPQPPNRPRILLPAAPKAPRAVAKPASEPRAPAALRGAAKDAREFRTWTVLPIDLPVLEETPSNPVTLAELTRDMCKWPLGDPLTDEFRFCGATRLAERSYCVGHAFIAYVPSNSKKVAK